MTRAVREIPVSSPIHATARVPGSKSITNRALVCAALASGNSRIVNASGSDDSLLMVNGLNQFGVLVTRDADVLVVAGKGGKLFGPRFPIPVANAGTTLRFLMSLGGLAKGTTILEGSERMAERPNEDLVAALRDQGVNVLHREGTSRFEVSGGPLRGGTLAVRSGSSSQFLSSLLLAAPYATTPLTLKAAGGMTSASYIGLTLDVMRSFRAEVNDSVPETFVVSNERTYVGGEFVVEADASGASYPLAAAAIAGGEVFVPGLREDSRQGDIRFLEILRMMGCRVEGRDGGVFAARGEGLRGIDIDMNSMPDIVPTLASVALFAAGTTFIRNIAHLRYKESNRAEGLAEELRKLGADVRVLGDAIEIHPASLHGAQLDTHDDHRLAMSFALIGLRVQGVKIENPECVRKSFPAFWEEFANLTRGSAPGR